VRITFLTGGLEPAADGVGDYSRLLAMECARRGVACQLVALADPHVRSVTSHREFGVDSVRLPHDMPWRARLEALGRTLASFRPEWSSLQFVPYSFQRWGIPWQLVQGLAPAVAPSRRHLMLHEIWIKGSGSWRTRLISSWQKRCVVSLCRARGALVHTSNRTYQRQLSHERISVRRLPLFGSIPVLGISGLPWLAPALASAGCNAASDREQWWLFVFFGTLHPVWPAEPLFSRLQAAAVIVRKRVAIVSVGRLGSGESLWTGLQQAHGDRIPMVQLGQQSVERISSVLNAADFGIATTPYALLDKSATVAAMFEHGLPVIVNREDGFPATEDSLDADERSQVLRLDPGFEQRLAAAGRRPPQSRLPSVAQQFLADLSAASVEP
jgi:hypothetical protein